MVVQAEGIELYAADGKPVRLEIAALEAVVVNADVLGSSVEALLVAGHTEVHRCHRKAGRAEVGIVDPASRPLGIVDATDVQGFGAEVAEIVHCGALEVAVLGDMATDWDRERHCRQRAEAAGVWSVERAVGSRCSAEGQVQRAAAA